MKRAIDQGITAAKKRKLGTQGESLIEVKKVYSLLKEGLEEADVSVPASLKSSSSLGNSPFRKIDVSVPASPKGDDSAGKSPGEIDRVSQLLSLRSS